MKLCTAMNVSAPSWIDGSPRQSGFQLPRQARWVALLLAALFLVGCKSTPPEAPGDAGTVDPGDGVGTTVDPVGSGQSTPGQPNVVIDRTPETTYDPGFATWGDGSAVSSVVYFAYDRALLPPDARTSLNAHAKYLRDNPQRTVLLEGHCDERGTREYNLALGERRANSVRDYLIGEGVRRSQIDTVSYGEEKPAVNGHDDSAWRQNRRAQIDYRR